MPKAKRPALTDDGEEMPPNPSKDVEAAIHLLEWARSKGFRVGPALEVGSVKMMVSDLRQVKNEGLVGKREKPDGGIYGEYGLDPNDIPADGTAG